MWSLRISKWNVKMGFCKPKHFGVSQNITKLFLKVWSYTEDPKAYFIILTSAWLTIMEVRVLSKKLWKFRVG